MGGLDIINILNKLNRLLKKFSRMDGLDIINILDGLDRCPLDGMDWMLDGLLITLATLLQSRISFVLVHRGLCQMKRRANSMLREPFQRLPACYGEADAESLYHKQRNDHEGRALCPLFTLFACSDNDRSGRSLPSIVILLPHTLSRSKAQRMVLLFAPCAKYISSHAFRKRAPPLSSRPRPTSQRS